MDTEYLSKICHGRAFCCSRVWVCVLRVFGFWFRMISLLTLITIHMRIWMLCKRWFLWLHRNLFQQSYTLQVQWILEAVFARLWVRHQSRNFGNGGLGTAHNSLGAASVYGPDGNVLMWDSQMTEGDGQSIDLMHRQQILGGSKVWVVWGLHGGVSKEFFLKGLIFCSHRHNNRSFDMTMIEADSELTLTQQKYGDVTISRLLVERPQK